MNPDPQSWPVVFFPDPLVFLIVYGALALTGLAAATLMWLIIKDRRNKEIW